ncbi:MAG TPA: DUF971 domain-containing protein [Chromatiales bacterium]|jgi:DUF971 family protein|nr:DUF971 domain-containing protein [Chromatiaceae bacterium]HIB84797.1 DUF971 domain-containing protein [Chromatiaceae bacterium]HIN81589.1 DUF971 domain-containing protein [Chromatiales bacterium]HIO14632.1 DUF971 domain-containing protein [Chromatiales bacterium]HIO54728.1 DUF971 domain-containing protein [Chromatiales bacterium]
MNSPTPTEINLHQKSRVLDITFDDGERFSYSCEYLRVNSPSAEVQGHGPGQGTLQIGKENVNIKQLEPIGNYAVCIHFDDDHNTGIYAWETLYSLGQNMDKNWALYLERLQAAGHSHKES